jgi:ankyrin repeat protein
MDKANWEFAHRLLQCVAAAFRPLRVTELAEILSFDFKTGPIPIFHEGWRLGDPVDAVLSTTSSLLAIVDVQGTPVIQFSHFSVKEYLTSARLAGSPGTEDTTSRRYHISMTPAHTLTAKACLGMLLHLDKDVIGRRSLEEYPLAGYAAKYWVEHARFEGVSGNVEDGMKRLFDPSKTHFAIWVWIYDPMLPSWMQENRRAVTTTRGVTKQAEILLRPSGSPLHYAALYGLHAIVKFLVTQNSQDVHSRSFDDALSPLHLASRQGHEDVARSLLEHGASTTAQDKDGSTPLHLASERGCQEVTRLLLEHGADATAQTKFGPGSTPLHLALLREDNDIARLLLEYGADTTVRTKDGSTPLHLAMHQEHDGIARSLLERGADTTAQTKEGWTPLHMASRFGREDLARLLLDHGADTTAQTKDGSTPLHLALQLGREGVARLLLKHGADAAARNRYGSTPLCLALQAGHGEVARLLVEHDTDTTGMDEQVATP